ncbi:MAG: anthraniloyl-CoA monooxygenase [Acidobacteriota bacterium]|nr:anthraniloyl-CoA monooxygenase [Acidobacteriota bacterium]
MKINVIGGGPAGLYFALLMKARRPAHEVTLFERNAPDSTFGWGVVFSDKTLSYLRDNDEPTHDEITRAFATWDNVDVVHRGEKVSIHGNKFSGIARIKLLNILQVRCESLGVRLRFQEEIADVERLRDCDLLVGADGVNSAVRERYRDGFEPDVSVRANKYVWFGTRRLFHGLTLTFRENADGIFAAHSYKFDAQTSTFIVECDPQTWDEAGFDSMSDAETRAYLREVFADDLQGHDLLSNNSRWINFLLVRNARWHFENVVLLGDALHTAHFSIGSGTKLALEDAIALARAFDQTSSVANALAEFERARKPIVEEYQRAAHESLVWFERMRDYAHLAPLPFAFSLMTRSKKIDYENLRRRDPAFVAAYEATLARASVNREA